ncbi:MAG TPA: hypothetical protein VGR63_15180 [Casimicrobiaceae bacterium]|nr:hypothetical protein [Casimicrobiaceae bacterium]
MLTFEAVGPSPDRPARAARPARSATLDLAGERRPRCMVAIPAAPGPGLYHGACGCGAMFVSVVLGSGDPEVAYVACWEREQARPAGPAPGATLFSPRRQGGG